MALRLERWTPDDRPLLDRLVGDPAMMVHLGGPESPEKIDERQARYERGEGVFKVVDAETGAAVGWVGYWPLANDGRGEIGTPSLEIGWSILTEFQGRGLATEAASLCLDAARAAGRRGLVTAHPGVDNASSNAVCRKLGMAFAEAVEVDYPPGHPFRANRWECEL
jgi:RimJ/RimL family protein N-acetyltransferase